MLHSRTRTPQIRIDWKAYFKAFCEAHGDPILYKGRLLFPDGYQYSATDYAGPEYPPEESLERAYRIVYYRERRKLLRERESALIRRLEALERLQSALSVPLQYSWTDRDETTGKIMRGTQSLDFDIQLREPIEDVRADMKRCEEMLRELKDDGSFVQAW